MGLVAAAKRVMGQNWRGVWGEGGGEEGAGSERGRG